MWCMKTIWSCPRKPREKVNEAGFGFDPQKKKLRQRTNGRRRCTSCGRLPLKAMMETTDARHAQNSCRIAPPPFENTSGGRIFGQGVMNAILVVVPDVTSNQPPQMGLAQYNHAVEQVSAAACNPALRHTVIFGLRGRWRERKAPVPPEPAAMPAHDSLRLHDNQHARPS